MLKGLEAKCLLCQQPAEPIRPWDAEWDQKCARSICKLLQVDQKDIPTLFGNHNYCTACHEFIRDVDFTMRSLAALEEKSRELKNILSEVLLPKSNRPFGAECYEEQALSSGQYSSTASTIGGGG